MVRRRNAPRGSSVLVLVVGLTMVALYHLLSALEVGKIGAPTDIGGGLIVLVGYLTVGIGVVLVVRDLRRARQS